MSFIRIRTRRNRRYLYEETRYREGKRVRSVSRYIGPLDGPSSAQARDEEQHRHYESAMRAAAKMDAWQVATFGETGAQRAEREAQGRQFDGPSFLGATESPEQGQEAAKDADPGTSEVG